MVFVVNGGIYRRKVHKNMLTSKNILYLPQIFKSLCSYKKPILELINIKGN
jgi:hypothetical protein